MKGWILLFVIVGILAVGIGYGLDKQAEDRLANTWYQDVTVVELRHTSWTTSVLLEADDAKRYVLRCQLCVVGDVVQIKMIEDRAQWIVTRYNAP